VAVLKVLEQIRTLQVEEDEEKIAMINTDSKVTLDKLKNRNKLYTNREHKERNEEAGGPRVDSVF
jgi:hypothetical protein